MNDVIVEWAAFSRKPGVTEAALVAQSDAMQRAFLSQQPGYRSRDLVKLDDNRYADLVFWETSVLAEAAMARAPSNEVCVAYFALLEGDATPLVGARLRRYDASATLADVGGIEFSRFAPLPGVSDAALVSTATRMTRDLYQGESGFLRHMVVKSHDGEYADVVLATSAKRASELCAKWEPPPHHAAYRDYVKAIDPESIALGFYDALR